MARRAAALACALALGLAGCGQELPQTATLGGSGGPPVADATQAGNTALVDARGRPLPPPPVPASLPAQAVRAGDDTALALWVHEGRVVASTWTREAGWSGAQPLEEIYGVATDAQLASNGRGVALAVWRHTVGSIQSLRFSRFEQGAGWSRPDVMPGALPQADVAGSADDGPRLQMDAAGNATAQWPSGFHAGEMQTARYVDGQGWTEASAEPVATAGPPPAAPGPR